MLRGETPFDGEYISGSASADIPRMRDEDVVMFFDSDDTMRPGLCDQVKRVFDSHWDIDLVSWLECVHTLDGNQRISKPMGGYDAMERHLVHAVLSTQRYAVRAGVFARAGGWNPEIMVWNDWETGIRVLAQNPRIYSLDRPLVDVYSQVDSITGTGFSTRAGVWESVLEEGRRSLRLVTGEERFLPESMASIERYGRIIDYRAVILAAHYSREGHPEFGSVLICNNQSGLPVLMLFLLRLV